MVKLMKIINELSQSADEFEMVMKETYSPSPNKEEGKNDSPNKAIQIGEEVLS